MDEYHHYKHEFIDGKVDRVAVYERHVADLLLASKLTDKQRESSLLFELKHQHGTVQCARILARKRGLNEDVCALGALLHDIHVGINGTYKDHARKSADIANAMIDELGFFSNQEKDQIIKFIAHHSEKDIWTDDQYKEIGKDADILDCFLLPNVLAWYKANKPPIIYQQYVKRAKKVWNELGMSIPKEWNYDKNMPPM